LVRWIFYAGLYFVIRDLPLSGQEKIKKNMPLVGLGCALLGLIQYCFLPDTRFIAEYGWDPHYFRLVGTFLDPGFLGMIFVFTLIMITLRLWSEKTLFNYLAWMIVYVALALTYSRASYLAYITSMGIIALRKRTIKFFAAILVVGIITIFLLPRAGGESTRLERESTIRFRITSWQHALIIARDHPLLGIGFNAYRNAQRQYNFFDDKFWEVSHGAAGADSSLLFVLATTGLVGLASFLYLGYEVIKQAKGDLLINASLGGLFIHSFFLNSLFYPWVMAWMWICIGFTHAPKPPIRKSKNDPHLA
jgi:O-antigen ligase